MSHTGRYKTLYSNMLLRCGCYPCELYTVFSGLLQSFRSHLGIGFSRGDAFVPQELLDKPDVAGLVVDIGGECVPKCMGRNGFVDFGLKTSSANDPLDLAGGEPLVTGVSEQRRDCPICKCFQKGHEHFTDDDLLRISSFGVVQGDGAGGPVDVVCVKGNGLGKSASSGQHEHQNGPIPLSPFAAEIITHQTSDLILSQNFGGQ